MKITYIGLQDLIGHKFNGMDLCRAMRARGEDAKFFVFIKKSREPWVRSITGAAGRIFFKTLNRIEYYTGLQNIISPMTFFLRTRKHIRESDIIHFQMIQFRFFSVFMVRYFARRKKVFWTLHDPWPLTGHCLHPAYAKCRRWMSGCGECPDLKVDFPIPFDTTRLLFHLKKRAFSSLKMNVIVTSDYMKSMVERSGMFQEAAVWDIPLGIDRSVFFRRDRGAVRKILGIASDEFSIFFRASRGPYKGLGMILKALDMLGGEKVAIIAVHEVGLLDSLKNRFKVIDLGWVEDDTRMAELYSAADVFLMPSQAESFGMMAIEAMACSTPVIACDNTALTETLDFGNAGILIRDGDADALADAIRSLRHDPRLKDRLVAKGLEIVAEKYNYGVFLERTVHCYREGVGPSLNLKHGVMECRNDYRY